MIRSFGRRRDRTLSQRQKDFLFNSPLLSKDSFIPFVEVLEIGFGKNKLIADLARENPHLKYAGVETYENGVASLLSSVEGIDNLIIFNRDIRELTIDGANHIYVFHPDPWPKKRHQKRRLITKEFLLFCWNKFYKSFIISTDDDDYLKYIVNNLKDINLTFNLIDVKEEGDSKGLPITPYGYKALKEGRICHYLVMVK